MLAERHRAYATSWNQDEVGDLQGHEAMLEWVTSWRWVEAMEHSRLGVSRWPWLMTFRYQNPASAGADGAGARERASVALGNNCIRCNRVWLLTVHVAFVAAARFFCSDSVVRAQALSLGVFRGSVPRTNQAARDGFPKVLQQLGAVRELLRSWGSTGLLKARMLIPIAASATTPQEPRPGSEPVQQSGGDYPQAGLLAEHRLGRRDQHPDHAAVTRLPVRSFAKLHQHASTLLQQQENTFILGHQIRHPLAAKKCISRPALGV